MELRKLEISEHGQTRMLWEKVFPEDTKAFLDYYYFLKTRDNEIYVIDEDEAIRSMLQLNPYLIRCGENVFKGHYIIAVATEEAYRKRGYMGKLLRASMQQMYLNKEVFTFLMPASEAIYTPYDFRFVYDQNVWQYTASYSEKSEDSEHALQDAGVTVSEAGIGDGTALADFFNRYFAEKFSVYAVRDESYYQTMHFEQQSENGGIKLLKKDGETVGSFLYGDEDGLEIREPLYLREYGEIFWNAVKGLCEERRQKQAMVYAGIAGEGKISSGVTKTETKPTIMMRIIHLESLLKVIKIQDGETINCSFAVLDSILPQNSRVWRLQSADIKADGEEKAENKNRILVSETEDSEGVLSIAALTSLLFGYKSVEEAAEEADVYMSRHLMEELKKIQPLKPVYLNEIV